MRKLGGGGAKLCCSNIYDFYRLKWISQIAYPKNLILQNTYKKHLWKSLHTVRNTKMLKDNNGNNMLNKNRAHFLCDFCDFSESNLIFTLKWA